jgi:hypothetical protein
MTESTATEVQQLVQQGRAAALAGDTYAARASFRRATELDPTCAGAWAGLSGVVPILAEKREYLQRALELEPANGDIAASLRYVEQLQGEGMQIEPSRRRAERLASSDGSPLLSTPEPAVVATEIEYCYRHPDRETGLHCTVCGRPICGECAMMTSVGQLCPDDRKARRPSNYKVSAKEVIVGGLVAFFASALVALVLSLRHQAQARPPDANCRRHRDCDRHAAVCAVWRPPAAAVYGAGRLNGGGAAAVALS